MERSIRGTAYLGLTLSEDHIADARRNAAQESPTPAIHLFRYIDEQAFRYNNRKDMNDSERFSAVVSQVTGKRLTYAELTGKVGERPGPTVDAIEPGESPWEPF